MAARSPRRASMTICCARVRCMARLSTRSSAANGQSMRWYLRRDIGRRLSMHNRMYVVIYHFSPCQAKDDIQGIEHDWQAKVLSRLSLFFVFRSQSEKRRTKEEKVLLCRRLRQCATEQTIECAWRTKEKYNDARRITSYGRAAP